MRRQKLGGEADFEFWVLGPIQNSACVWLGRLLLVSIQNPSFKIQNFPPTPVGRASALDGFGINKAADDCFGLEEDIGVAW